MFRTIFFLYAFEIALLVSFDSPNLMSLVWISFLTIIHSQYFLQEGRGLDICDLRRVHQLMPSVLDQYFSIIFDSASIPGIGSGFFVSLLEEAKTIVRDAYAGSHGVTDVFEEGLPGVTVGTKLVEFSGKLLLSRGHVLIGSCGPAGTVIADIAIGSSETTWIRMDVLMDVASRLSTSRLYLFRKASGLQRGLSSSHIDTLTTCLRSVLVDLLADEVEGTLGGQLTFA